MADDHVTGAEFGRWRLDYQASQERLEDRLKDGFDGIHNRLDELNGRTRRNSEGIVAVERDINLIQERGCGQFAQHQKMLDERIVASPGVAGTGLNGKMLGILAAAMAAITALARIAEAFIHHLTSGQ